MNRQQRRAAMRNAGAPGSAVAAASAPQSQIRDIFAEGFRRHQAGRLGEAEQFYRRVLAFDPRHADSLHLLGVVACDSGRLDAGIALIEKAIAINPRAARYHFDLGTARQQRGQRELAVACYREAVALEPRYLEAHSNLGGLLRELGQPEEAIVHHRRALDLAPNSPQIHNNLGIALQAVGRNADAMASYRRALALRPDYATAHSNLGNALKEAGRFDEAIASYRRALALSPANAEARLNLAIGLQDQGRFAEAIAAYEEALRHEADPGACYHGISVCLKFKPEDRPMIERMQDLLRHPSLPVHSRARLQFGLGKAFDDLGDYETAIRHFDEGNRLARQTRPYNASTSSTLADSLIAAFGAPISPAPGASDSELPIFIVGMPRSGTTMVEQILASHSAVAAGGELNFWQRRLLTAGDELLPPLDGAGEQAAIGDYLALLRNISPVAARVTDKMPFNFLCLGQINRLFPKARLIHCRRSPVDTALSIYLTRFAGPHDFSYSRADIVAYYRDYSQLMAHWRRVLPPGRMLEIDYEALVADPEPVTRDLVGFCGLDWESACLEPHKTDRPIATASAWQARQPVYRSSAERWRKYEPWLGELRELFTLAASECEEGGGAASSKAVR